MDCVKLTNISSRKSRHSGLTSRGMINIEIIFKENFCVKFELESIEAE